jgi:hypothetical protein
MSSAVNKSPQRKSPAAGDNVDSLNIGVVNPNKKKR